MRESLCGHAHALAVAEKAHRLRGHALRHHHAAFRRDGRNAHRLRGQCAAACGLGAGVAGDDEPEHHPGRKPVESGPLRDRFQSGGASAQRKAAAHIPGAGYESQGRGGRLQFESRAGRKRRSRDGFQCGAGRAAPSLQPDGEANAADRAGAADRQGFGRAGFLRPRDDRAALRAQAGRHGTGPRRGSSSQSSRRSRRARRPASSSG